MKKKFRIVICVEGGIVNEVQTSDDCEIILIDHDIEGASSDDIHPVPQTDGTTVDAYVFPLDPVVYPSNVDYLFEILDK
jgi:hypothetical protein